MKKFHLLLTTISLDVGIQNKIKKKKAMTQGFQTVKKARRAGTAVAKSAAADRLSNVKLSTEQANLKLKIMEFTRSHLKSFQKGDKPSMFVIQGDAGTGKSVVLNSLFNEIQKASTTSGDALLGTSNYLVVNHPEMLKLYLNICKKFPYISRNCLERPTSLINKLQKDRSIADVVIVDEAHLLATSKDSFKRFYGQNHLQELMGLAKVLIIVYDEKQALRMGCFWDEESGNGANLQNFYDQVPDGRKDWYRLKQQFRVAAPPDVLQWIEDISVKGVIPKYPQKSEQFDFKIWDDCGAMFESLKEHDANLGQCRMLATYDFPYRLDGKDYYVTCGDNFKVRWDRYTPKAVLPWSERSDTIDEVGSVYTIQGFDLKYAGVILGRSIGYDAKNDCIMLKPEMYDDHAGFTKKKNIKDSAMVERKIIMNSLNVLLTRGVNGLYVYAWDPELRQRLAETRK
ncbi:hypothetical protein ZYGM_001203 [Zygosaccharomyces mellis]|uniref:Schlafen group 3-like DNA/RNA helicase domain-containing protein n=1 Tax=Zygosaccharomyces mellis TaxID=42258 RepID=A0A4C2EB85_9SACH|nr:hypothetical protein ZYGM_001203 [Zygosaccharomyces mellis]